MGIEPQRFLRMTACFGEQRGPMIKGVVEVLEYFGESGVSQGKSRVLRNAPNLFTGFPSRRELLKSKESIQVLRSANSPSPSYRARSVVRLSRGGLR